MKSIKRTLIALLMGANIGIIHSSELTSSNDVNTKTFNALLAKGKSDSNINLSVDGGDVAIRTGAFVKDATDGFAIYKFTGRESDSMTNFGDVVRRYGQNAGKASIPTDSKNTYSTIVTQLKDGYVASGPYESGKIIIGKWDKFGKPANGFGTDGKVIVTLQEGSMARKIDPFGIAKDETGDLSIIGTFKEGKKAYPFIVKIDKNGYVKEKRISTSNDEKNSLSQLNMNKYPETKETPGMQSGKSIESLMNR